MQTKQIINEMKKLADPIKAQILARFFKTGPGGYGAGDKFLGIVVPKQRNLAKKIYREVNLKTIAELISNPYHEIRLLAYLILTYQYPKATTTDQKLIYNFYIKNTKHANNWDLVDLSAPNIIGRWLLNHDRKILYKFARSKNLWTRRVAVIATFTFIRAGEFRETLALADILMNDQHDLIHKAVGWMLREVGKRDQVTLESYLSTRYKKMPRTMLRYAIEKFPELKRRAYLKNMAEFLPA